MDEIDIIKDVIAGIDRYEELVCRYHIGVIIHCENLLKNRADAEDIAQEAFIKAYLQLTKFNPKLGKFSTWLYKIATNLCIDHLRKQKGLINMEDIESLAQATMPTFIEDEERQILRTAVSKLQPPEYQQLIEGYYWQGKSYLQLSEELNIPLNTARTWLRRAKLQLRKELA